MALNLEKQLLFYGAYHHDPVNVAIHITCVPLILFSGFQLLENTGAVPLPSYLTIPNLPLNGGTIAAFLYASLYILMEPVAGAMLAPIIMGVTALTNHWTELYGTDANRVAFGLHLFGWIAQFIGHGKFEGRAPALLDNLVQAIFLAPFFVWFEILFYFGYRPELKKRLDVAIKQEISKFKATQVKKPANGSAK